MRTCVERPVMDSENYVFPEKDMERVRRKVEMVQKDIDDSVLKEERSQSTKCRHQLQMKLVENIPYVRHQTN